MKTWFKSCVAALAGAAVTVLGTQSALAQPSLPIDETNVIVVIDVTGSMTAEAGSLQPGEDPDTRLEIGRLRALRWLINDTSDFVEPEFAVWEFSTDGTDDYRVLQDFTDDVLQAIGAVGAAAQTPYRTPLAGTICDAVDRLHDYEDDKIITDPTTGLPRLSRIERRIYLVTDGLENETPSTNECWGPDAVTDTVYPVYDYGSWQWKVLNKLKTGNANTPSDAPFEYIIDVQHILTSFISSADPLAAEREAAALEGLPAGSMPYSTVEQDVSLFRGLAQQSGGTYTQLAPNPQGVISFSIPGDANGDDCVDYDDYAILVQVYGYPVTSDPLTIQADFNGDGWVDDDDYMLLIQHWGEGC
jgi:hypothetical protein